MEGTFLIFTKGLITNDVMSAEYIHSPKYLWIFQSQYTLTFIGDFFSYEYIQTFIQDLKLQQIYYHIMQFDLFFTLTFYFTLTFRMAWYIFSYSQTII